LHSLTANYDGDANNIGAVSTPVNVLVGSAATPGSPMTWVYQYDSQGNRTSEQDPNGNITSTTYDSLQRPAIVRLPAPVFPGTAPAIGYTYDGQDKITSVTDPRNLATTYGVDGLGRVAATVSPDTGASSATYDALGNLLTRTDSRGKVTTYSYDATNRVTSIGYSSGVGTVFEYDGGVAPYPR
jgi:YD repeat-containing protein